MPSRDGTSSPLDGLALRAPPAAPLAEQALLGALLANNKAYSRVADFLLPDHFSDPIHGRIYQEIQNLVESQRLADAITLRQVFEHSGVLDEVGGTAYLAQLLTAMVGIINAGEYGRAIVDAWQRRKMIEAGEAIVHAAFDGTMAPGEAVGRTLSMLDAALDMQTSGRAPMMLIDAVDATIDDAETAAVHGGPVGLSTGMPSIDKALGGLLPGEMLVLAARPGMGKSALGVQWARAAAQACRDRAAAGEPRSGVLVISLEMSAKQLARRVLAAEAEVPVAVLKDGRHGPYVDQIVAGRRRLHDLPLLIEDIPGLGPKQLALRARAAERRFGRLALIVVDHLHIVRAEASDVRNGGTWAVGQVSNALKRLAKDFDCPVVALAQLNRAVDGRDEKRPTMADLRQSGEIEQDADQIAFIYREEYYLGRADPVRKPGESQQAYADRCLAMDAQRAAAKGKAEVILAKLRDGEPTTVNLRWRGAFTAFSDPGMDDERQMDMERDHG